MAFELKRDWPILAAVGVGGVAVLSFASAGSAGGSSSVFPTGGPTGSGQSGTSGSNASTAVSILPAIIQYEEELNANAVAEQEAMLAAESQSSQALFAYLKPNPPAPIIPGPPKPDVFGEILAAAAAIFGKH